MTAEQIVEQKRKKRKLAALVIAGVGFLLLGTMAVIFLVITQSNPLKAKKDWVSVTPMEEDFPAPQLELTDIDGNPVSLSKLDGQVVLLNNWAFWCPPCRDELPELQAYFNAHQKQGFTIIGIEAGDEKEDVVYHVKLFKMTYPVWLDPNGYSSKAFNNGNLPNSYVIDKKGRVRLSWVGAIDLAMLEKYVTPLLKE